jgi:hypothetical protein
MHEAFLTKRDLYLAAIGPLCKIGVSRRPKRRVTGLSQTQPHRANLIKVWPKVGHLEPMVHSILEPLRQRSEWFRCSLGFAEWVCEMAVSQKQQTASRAVLLYKQLMDCRARWERLGGFKGAEDERRTLWSATKSLENDLHAAGFDTGGYRFQISFQCMREQDDARRRDPWGKHLHAAPTGDDPRRPRPPRMTQEQMQERKIAALAPHQIAALRAVSASCGFDNIDAFTFNVLGHIGLLKRPRGSKAKTDWQLTDEGRAALEQLALAEHPSFKASSKVPAAW